MRECRLQAKPREANLEEGKGGKDKDTVEEP